MSRRSLRLAATAAAIVVVLPTIAAAQWSGTRSNRDSTDSCGAAGCSWFLFMNSLPAGSLNLSSRATAAAQFYRPLPFSASADLFSSLSDCPACKSNNRPFIVPPGIVTKLANQGSNQSGGHGGSGDDDGEHENGAPGAASGVGPQAGLPANGNGASNAQGGNGNAPGQASTGGIVAAAVTPSVIVTPEPGALVLVATGLLALVPVVVRSRERRR